MEEKKLVIVSVPYKPFLSVVKAGCKITNVSFLIVEYRKFWVWKVLFRLCFALRLYTLATKCKISTNNFKEFRKFSKNSSTRFLFWSPFYLPWWISMSHLIPQNDKKCFCWGPVGNAQNIKKRERYINMAKNLGIAFYTMNASDANKYGMFYTTQCYRYFNDETMYETKYDFFFLGYKKGREKILLSLQNKLQQKGFSTNFIIRDHNQPETDFSENVKLAKQSRCIVDIVASQSIYKQDGMTLRPLEALFLGKKLITNFNKIKEFDFYHPNNIYIIDEQFDLNSLESFMQKPYHTINDDIVKKYEVNNWINRYFME